MQAAKESSGRGVHLTAHNGASTANVTALHQPDHLRSRLEGAHCRTTWAGVPHADNWMPAAQMGGLRQQWQHAQVIQQPSSAGRGLEAQAAVKQVRLDGRARSSQREK